MKSLRLSPGRFLLWKQPKWAVDHFRLHAGEDLVGELYWTKCLSDQAVAKFGEGSWALDRIGFFRDRAVAIDGRTGMEAARFAFGWLGEGGIHLANGRVFRWRRTKAFASAWTLVDEIGQRVYDLEIGMHWFKVEAAVSLSTSTERMSEIGLLLCMGLYIARCTMQDAAGAVVVASAAIVA
jgi:hypothetical protein